jgi:putative transposase
MARKSLIRTSVHPYHVIARSNNKEFFYLDLNELWNVFMESFNKAQLEFHCKFHAFVLMSNHYHLLISTPEENLGEIMQFVQRSVAQSANKKVRRINHFFGGPYKWSIIESENYYWNCLKYIFRNPVRAEICYNVNQYKFSSLNTKPKDFKWSMVDFHSSEQSEIELNLEWLNEPFGSEIEEKIRFGLRRKEFKLPRSYSGKEAFLDTPLSKK